MNSNPSIYFFYERAYCEYILGPWHPCFSNLFHERLHCEQRNHNTNTTTHNAIRRSFDLTDHIRRNYSHGSLAQFTNFAQLGPASSVESAREESHCPYFSTHDRVRALPVSISGSSLHCGGAVFGSSSISYSIIRPMGSCTAHCSYVRWAGRFGGT